MAIMPVNKIGTNGQMIVQSEWFVARITEVDTSETGTGDCVGTKHGWIEQAICANGTAYEDAPAEQAEVGDLDFNSAYPIGGGTASVDDLVLMRVKGLDDNGLSVYEFLSAGASSSSSTANARVKIATADVDGRIGILQSFTGSGTVRTFSDGSRVYVHEVNGYTAFLPVGAIFLAQELAPGIYGVQLDPTAVISAICDETGLTVETRM